MTYFQLTQKNYLEIGIICLIILLSIFVSSYVRDTTVDYVWQYDDLYDLNVAQNLKNGDGLITSYAPWKQKLSVSNIIEIFPDGVRDSPRVPLYSFLLAGYLSIIHYDVEDLFLVGSIFNTTISIILIVTIFIFTRQNFSLIPAILSTLIITTSYWIIFHSVHVSPRPLAYLFIIIGLILLQKNKINYYLLGIVAGLAHLSNPLSIFFIISCFVFFLLKKQFKNSLKFLATYVLLVFPIMIHDAITFGNFGVGLIIPYSQQISNLFGLTSSYGRYEPATNIPTDLSLSTFFSIFISDITNNPILLIIGFSLFGLISTIFLLIYSKNKISENISSNFLLLLHFTVVFFSVSLIGYFLAPIVGIEILNMRYLFPQLILFSSIGVFVAIQIIFKLKIISTKPIHIITLIIFILIISAFMLGSIHDSINKINDTNTANAINNFPGLDSIHSWIIETIPQNSVIATNYQLILNEKTSMISIFTPPNIYHNEKQAKQYFEHYKPDYLVVYYTNNSNPGFPSDPIITNKFENKFDLEKIYHEKQYGLEYEHKIFKINYLLN